MRLTKLFFTAVIATSSFCLFSCSDKNEPDLPPPPVPFSSPINSIEANAGVNLTPRKDWIFTILNTTTEYTATINALNSVGVLIRIGEKEYYCPLSHTTPKTRLSMPVQGIGGSSVLTFDVKMDAENNVLIEAESYKKQVIEWPIETADR